MLIWINGAFGAGKTSVADELCRRNPDALLFDPEQVGFMLRKIIPGADMPADFQDLPLWRQLTVTTAIALLRARPGPLIVPMAVTNPLYFDEILRGLFVARIAVHHFTLVASTRTLRTRLLRRWSLPQSKFWTLRQVDRCVTSLADPRFATHIHTNDRTVPEIAVEIAACVTASTARRTQQQAETASA